MLTERIKYFAWCCKIIRTKLGSLCLSGDRAIHTDWENHLTPMYSLNDRSLESAWLCDLHFKHLTDLIFKGILSNYKNSCLFSYISVNKTGRSAGDLCYCWTNSILQTQALQDNVAEYTIALGGPICFWWGFIQDKWTNKSKRSGS